jgi:hypothetical protein
MGSSLYESWVTRLRVSWMGTKAQRIFGGWSAALGDKAVDWARQGLLEHLPGYASDPTSVALTADERQLDTYPGEPTADLAARAPYWLEINKFRGRGLGLLLGLHFAGFDNVVIVQQNGRALQLQLPLPDFSGDWDPTPNKIITPCTPLATTLTSSMTPPTGTTAGRRIPAPHPWWTFDNDTDFCSRFAVLFPSASLLNQVTGRAVFTNSSSATMQWNTPVADANYYPLVGQPVVLDGGASIAVAADGTTQTPAGITINADAPFTGYVDGEAVGAMSAVDLLRLQATIRKWRPGRALCVGIYVQVQGQFFGWPVQQTWGTRPWGPFVSVQYPGA